MGFNLAFRFMGMVLVAVVVMACGDGASAPTLPPETPAPTVAATPEPTPSPTEAAKPWPIGLTRAQVAAVLSGLGYRPFDLSSVPSGTYVASVGFDVLSVVTISGSEARATGIDTTFYAAGGDYLNGLAPYLASGGSGADINSFLQDQGRRYAATGDYAKEELQVPGAIVQWQVSPDSSGNTGFSISVGEY
jgi:hypothetical protein